MSAHWFWQLAWNALALWGFATLLISVYEGLFWQLRWVWVPILLMALIVTDYRRKAEA